MEKVADSVKKELFNTLSSKSASFFKQKELKAIEEFSWSKASADASRTLPTLYCILDQCIGSRSRTFKSDLEKDVVLSVICGILLRSCSSRANLIQHIFSVLLSASHAPKQVI